MSEPTWLTTDQVARHLGLGRQQLDELLAAGWLAPDPDLGLYAFDDVIAVESMLQELELGRLGLAELEDVPRYVTADLAATWLGVERADVEALVDEGLLQAVRVEDLDDEALIEQVVVIEVLATDEEWTTEHALTLDTAMWWTRLLGKQLSHGVLRRVLDLIGEAVAYPSEQVRRLARRRRRLNPPEPDEEPDEEPELEEAWW